MKKQIKAACVLVLSNDSKILAVSRKNDSTAFGIPGGKLDEGESPIAAAIRETLEETGYTVNINTDNRLLCYQSDVDGILVDTFVATIDYNIPRQLCSEKETGVVSFVSREVLYKGPFSLYNKQLLSWYDELST